MRALSRAFLASLAAATLAAAGLSCSGGNPDCDQAREIWGPEGNLGAAHLHESCAMGSYGSCSESFSNCVEGVCQFSESANGSICTQTCATSSECGGWYCKDGACQPACASHTYCDGTICCDYAPDPADPTQCRQLGCTSP